VARVLALDDPESVVDQQRVLSALPVADTAVGDELWFHAEDRGTLIVLPRDGDCSYAVGLGVDGAIDWGLEDTWTRDRQLQGDTTRARPHGSLDQSPGGRYVQ
jgi:hypothetical protein